MQVYSALGNSLGVTRATRRKTCAKWLGCLVANVEADLDQAALWLADELLGPA
jgi:hypothetical protein